MAASVVKDGSGIVGRDPATRHDDDASRGLLIESLQKINALNGLGLLPRGENADTPQVYYLLECSERVTTAIKCTMKCHRHSLSGLHQTLHCMHINIALWCKCPEDKATAHWAQSMNVLLHDLDLAVGIYKVALSRTDEGHDLQMGGRGHMLQQAIGRCETAHRQGRTQLDATRPTLLGSQRTGQIRCTNFQFHISKKNE